MRMQGTADVVARPPRADRRRTPTWVRFVSEVIAIALYVGLGGGAEAQARLLAQRQHRPLGATDWLAIGVVHGLALFIGTILTRRMAGTHINPLVTVGLYVAKRLPSRQALTVLAGQFCGALVGALLILFLFGRAAASAARSGAPELAPGIGLVRGSAIEGLGAFVLALVISAGAMAGADEGWSALASGMTMIALTVFMGPATSASINPARAFGPDVLDALLGVPAGGRSFLVVYLLGPLAGGIVAFQLYPRFMRAASPQADSS
jgi:glycerol uptake facilitator protein